jgi:hypothetical protein
LRVNADTVTREAQPIFIFAIHAEGNESFSIVGRVVDLCPKLAA